MLEKSKLEKKVAVMESLKTAHYREASRAKYQLESLERDKEHTIDTLQKLTADETVYKNSLVYDKEGVKSNPIILTGINSTDSEVIGKYLITLYQQWKPEQESKIGSLYGFDLHIRQQREAIEEKGAFGYKYYNTLYAERAESGIKYTYNNGHPNTDNPKLAARYFLNAIDRVETLKEKYEKNLGEIEKNIPMVAALATKAFEKEAELVQMKSELSKKEREISLRIQENQMKQSGLLETDKLKQENDLSKEAPVIQMLPKEKMPLQPAMVRANGTTMNGKEHFKQNQIQQPRIKRSRGLRF